MPTSEQKFARNYAAGAQATAASQPMTAIDRLNNELQVVASNINTLCQRCDSIAVRHLGSEPTSPAQGIAESKLSPVPVGTFGEASAKIQGIHDSLSYLDTLVSRIEQI